MYIHVGHHVYEVRRTGILKRLHLAMDLQKLRRDWVRKFYKTGAHAGKDREGG
jgi:hypothetical protein